MGWDSANRLAAEADTVLAVGTRLGDFATGSWTVFGAENVRFVSLNAARFDAVKHGAFPWWPTPAWGSKARAPG